MIPLPLVENTLFVDNSLIEKLLCPREGEYYHLEQRVATAHTWPLFFGAAIHEALALRYRALDPLCPATEEAQMGLLHRLYENVEVPEDQYRNLDYALACIKAYNKNYALEFSNFTLAREVSSGEPLVEISFAHELGTLTTPPAPWVVYCGRIDLVIVINGRPFVRDTKTAFMLGNNFFADKAANPQGIGYCWALGQSLGILPLGYEVDAIRTTPPTNSKDEKKKRGLFIKEDFQRERYYINQEKVDEWRRNTLAVLEEYLWHHQRGFLPQKKQLCVTKYGKCPYYDVCAEPAVTRHAMLQSSMFSPNKWSPLKQVKHEDLNTRTT